MQTNSRKNVVLIVVFSLIFIGLISVGVWRYNSPLAASQQYFQALNRHDVAAVNQLQCQPTPLISFGGDPDVVTIYDLSTMNYSIQFEGLRSAVVHYHGTRLVIGGQPSTLPDDGLLIWRARGLSWCLSPA